KENCQLKKSIELSENIASVIDIWCEKGSKKVKLENGKVGLSGVLLIGMVVCDQNDNVVFYEKPVELEFEHKTECEGSNLSANTEIDIVNVGYTITSANCLEVRIELCITGTVYETNDIPLITDIEIDTNKPLFKNKKGGMLICFASKGEKVWNIARKYNANLQEIVSINNLAGDELENKKTILIPLC
ncbi:MAG: LysM peptidoglycan-binding domain-containing protein, partial [Clostridia bacterium]|nr:LysM peptidoglycan-binding domain-containing protein [Clostridia bacterium]